LKLGKRTGGEGGNVKGVKDAHTIEKRAKKEKTK